MVFSVSVLPQVRGLFQFMCQKYLPRARADLRIEDEDEKNDDHHGLTILTLRRSSDGRPQRKVSFCISVT